jgi:hypothetical protein
MGDWNTLHTFSDDAFSQNTLKIFEQDDLLADFYVEFCKYCLKGECRLPLSELRQYLDGYHQAIKKLFVVDDAQAQKAILHLAYKEEYHFREFFTFVIFRTCADFFPYFKLGYRAFSSSIAFRKAGTIAEEIISAMLYSYSDFNYDGNGIRKILSHSDVVLLEMDLDKVEPKNQEALPYIHEFKSYIQHLSENSLGLVSGQNLYNALLNNWRVKYNIGNEMNADYYVYKE